MNLTREHGRETLRHPVHGSLRQVARLAHTSKDEPDKLWIGERCLLTRGEVFELAAMMMNWAATGRLGE